MSVDIYDFHSFQLLPKQRILAIFGLLVVHDLYSQKTSFYGNNGNIMEMISNQNWNKNNIFQYTFQIIQLYYSDISAIKSS